jgi:hypothetical protein
MLFGALTLLAFLVFYLAAVFRKDSRRQHRSEPAAPPARVRENGVAVNGKIRRRKRRRDHRPRNPTRAETGGLPPRREEEEPPPA